MTRFYRLASDDEDLDDDGLLAVEMRNPDEKPRIRLVPIELEATSGEVFGGFAESRDQRHDSKLGNPDGYGAWYWQFFIWEPGTHITRGYGDTSEVLEVEADLKIEPHA